MAITRARFRVDTTPDTNSTTVLNGNVADADTGDSMVVNVVSGAVFEVGQNIKIDSEEMTITSISSNALTVTRGSNGTSAVAHTDSNQVIYKDDSVLYTPTNNPQIGSDLSKSYDGVISRKTLGGTTFSVANYSTSRVSRELTYENLSESNKDRLVALFDYAKGQLNSFQYSDDGNTWFTVRLTNNKLPLSETAYNSYLVGINIEEQL